MTADERIAEIRRRCDAATEGPWLVHPLQAMVVPAAELDTPIASLLWPTDYRGEDETFANAEFMAEARTDIPYLLAAFTAQQERIARLEAALVECMNPRSCNGALEYEDELFRISMIAAAQIADGSCQTCHGTKVIYLAGTDGLSRPCPVCCSHLIPSKAALFAMRDAIAAAIRAATAQGEDRDG